jgi:tol-pal system protein YbgF
MILLISACTTVTDLELLRHDVNRLTRESHQAKKDIASLNKKTAVAVSEDSFSAVRESQADINLRLSEISMNLQELRGRFEENKYFLEKTLKESSSDRDVLRAQIASLEKELNIMKDKYTDFEQKEKTTETTEELPEAIDTAIGTANSPEDTSEETTPELQGQVSEKIDMTKAYEVAYQTFKEKKHKESRELFNAFIKDYPENTLTDNAYFWIAETYYAEKDYEGSILSYETLLQKYPDSEKIPGALLKQGFAFIEIGDKKTGKIILEKLIEKFSDSKESTLAKKKLKKR